jgi:subtilisin family serine protease
MGCLMVHNKIAPGLLIALRDFENKGRKGLQAHNRTMGIVSKENNPKPARAVVFIHCKENASFDREPGITVNQAKGTVRTGIINLESVRPLSENRDVKWVAPSQFLKPMMDVAPGKVGLPAFQNTTKLRGKGIVLGVVDTGIDPKHAAFKGRILKIWDQVLSGDGVAEGNYGVELTGNLLTTSRDLHGHGTHVSGIAAGSDGTYCGVAPEADLVMVKTDFMDAHIADGIRYIFRVADELDRPAVVNLSLGGHWDPHDGTDSLSQIIDAESGPGKIVCCAAGNEGNDNIHAHASVANGKTKTIRFSVPMSGGGSESYVGLNIWYSGKDKMEAAIRSPDGSTTGYQGIITGDEVEKTYELREGKVTIATPGPDPLNGDNNIFVLIENATRATFPVKAGVWRLSLRGVSIEKGSVDAWTLTTTDDPVIFTGTSVQDKMKIGSPGASKSAITVAAYTTRIKWTDIDGHQQGVDFDLDDISDFSSEGPLRDGSNKPDVAAPGAMIISALSADSQVSSMEQQDNEFCVMAGTSMASPFLAGVVALLLERDPSLDPAGIKNLLKGKSKIQNKKPGTYHPKWGYGLLQMEKM